MGMNDEPESYEHSFFENQFRLINEALSRDTDILPPDKLRTPSGDVAADLRDVAAKVNELITVMNARTQLNEANIEAGDGGLGQWLERMGAEQRRQGNLQPGKNITIDDLPSGVRISAKDTRNEYPLPDETTLITWIKLTTPVTTPDPEDENQVPYAVGHPCENKNGDDPDETRTVRVYFVTTGGGSPVVTVDDVVPVQVDSNGDAISQQTGPSVPIGACIVWAGMTSGGVPKNIPTGWALCDGENETIDLRGKFPVGYDPDDTDYDSAKKTGGYATHGADTNDHTAHAAHDHNTNTGGTQVSGSIASSGAHTHSTTSAAGSEHSHGAATGETADWVTVGGTGDLAAATDHTHTGWTTDGESSHTHGVTISSSGAHTHSFDEGTPHTHTVTEQAAMTHSSTDNRPPWRVAVWIQRIA